MARRLEHESPRRTSFAGTSREQVQRADDIRLMSTARVHVERIDARHRVHDGIDANGAHQLANERVTDVELQVIGASEIVAGLASVDADDLGDIRIFNEALHKKCTPPSGDPGDENAPLL